MARTKKSAKKGGKKTSASAPKPQPMEDMAEKPAVWVPGKDGVGEGETLDYDPSVYDCLAAMRLDWPCLSFDVLRDHLGGPRSAFPHTMFMVAGTQAATAKQNYLAAMKVSNLCLSKAGRQRQAEAAGGSGKAAGDGGSSDSEDEAMLMSDEEEEEEEEEAKLHVRKVAHTGGINRVRAMPQQPSIVASFADSAQVQVWDLSSLLTELRDEVEPAAGGGKVHKLNARQVHSHSSEGYALDWSPVTEGAMVSGDCRARIHVWTPQQGGRWMVSGGYKGHEGSVEDLQWSPSEATVFASCSVDKTIRIWDTRDATKPQITVAAHEADVNVVSWNRSTAYMLASGGDDGSLRVWDLRHFADGSHVANLGYHRGPVTSVEWCPHEASMLATTSSDNQLAVWDLALERDPEEEAAMAPEDNALAPDNLPPQLLFVHSGQQDMKEGHWHPQIPGVLACTAADGFNLIKPYNV